MNRIYALVDPVSSAIRYVGKTKVGVADRLRGHINDAKRRGNRIPRFKWINGLLQQGLTPVVVLLEEVGADWQSAEKRWIKTCRGAGCDLLNATLGGDGIDGHLHSAATRQKMSESAKRLYLDPAEREKRGSALRKTFALPEVKARLSAALKVAFAKPGVRERLSAAQIKSLARPEVKAARSRAFKGRAISPEQRRKLSLAMKGRTSPPEAVAKCAASHVGLKHSEATLAKMRATWARKRLEKETLP